MKRYIVATDQKETLELAIDIFYADLFAGGNIAATTIRPVIKDAEHKIVDEAARADYFLFVENVFEIITAYGFEISKKFQHRSKSFPSTSEYRWVAHSTETQNNHVPKWINLRISEHFQSFGPEYTATLADQCRAQANELKMPSTRKVQRYIPDSINVDDLGCETYEEALHVVELKIRGWLKERGIDPNEYGDPIW